MSSLLIRLSLMLNSESFTQTHKTPYFLYIKKPADAGFRSFDRRLIQSVEIHALKFKQMQLTAISYLKYHLQLNLLR